MQLIETYVLLLGPLGPIFNLWQIIRDFVENGLRVSDGEVRRVARKWTLIIAVSKACYELMKCSCTGNCYSEIRWKDSETNMFASRITSKFWCLFGKWIWNCFQRPHYKLPLLQVCSGSAPELLVQSSCNLEFGTKYTLLKGESRAISALIPFLDSKIHTNVNFLRACWWNFYKLHHISAYFNLLNRSGWKTYMYEPLTCINIIKWKMKKCI